MSRTNPSGEAPSQLPISFLTKQSMWSRVLFWDGINRNGGNGGKRYDSDDCN